MRDAGLPVELLETRHVRDAFKAMPVKTDRNDARGIAQLMRLGWFRPVHCKSLPAQEVRALRTRFEQWQKLEKRLRSLAREGMRCRTTASLRASATFAVRMPARAARRIPQLLSARKFVPSASDQHPQARQLVAAHRDHRHATPPRQASREPTSVTSLLSRAPCGQSLCATILSSVSRFCPGSALGRHLMGSDEEQVGQPNSAQ
jgi:transposase